MLMHAIALRGYTDTVRESTDALKFTTGGKDLLPLLGLEPSSVWRLALPTELFPFKVKVKILFSFRLRAL